MSSPPSFPDLPPFLSVSGDDIILCSPQPVPADTLIRSVRKRPVLRPRRYDRLSRRARVGRDEFANSARMPKLVAKGAEVKKALMDDPVFVEAVRCLAGGFVELKCEREEVTEVKEDDDMGDEVENLNCSRKRQKVTEDNFFTWWKPLS